MDEGDVSVLKEALCKQCLLLEKLYIELEEEREASATAADEALSMILRLQVEKAEEKMEAGQYKKLTEEKMRHNEESMAILEEIIHQQETEITSLKHQVQVLKQRLLSAGVNDGDLGLCGPSTLKLNTFLNETGFRGSFRRNVSLPSIRLEQIFSEMDIVGKDRFPFHKGESICRAISDCKSQLIKNSEEHQRQCRDYKSLIKECTYQKFDLCTGFSGMSFGETRTNFSTKGVSSSPPPAEYHEAIVESGMLVHSYRETESNRNGNQLVSGQDISEAPECHTGHAYCEYYKRLSHEAEFEVKDKDVLSVSIPQEAKDCCLKGEDLLNWSFIYRDHAYKTRKTASITCHCNPVHSKIEIAPCKTEIDELKQWLLHLEDDGRTPKMDDPKRDNEQVKLLKEIQEQLNTIQLHIKNFLSRKQPQQDDSVYISLMEVS
ncbi:Aspartate/ornithine carbamoyltransferase protein [Dioscorea alata]|uniref:Aspartate/ornithine carbamoyltransferase protein n=1 Tax=Dioscorea alata TaxID=55571 RepID=A0ACB7UHL0_DIOAL|nr:Aspartate/ornithine carbamoyltransferase protein [Dioscorea alata]